MLIHVRDDSLAMKVLYHEACITVAASSLLLAAFFEHFFRDRQSRERIRPAGIEREVRNLKSSCQL